MRRLGPATVVALLLLVVGSVLAVNAAATATDEAPLVAMPGFWSLERLGYGEQLFTPSDLHPGFGPDIVVAGSELPYRLPPGAKQGGRTWYLLKMRYRLEIDEQSKPGLITVSSSSNGRTMAALDFRVLEPGSPPIVRGTAVSLTGSKLRSCPRQASASWTSRAVSRGFLSRPTPSLAIRDGLPTPASGPRIPAPS